MKTITESIGARDPDEEERQETRREVVQSGRHPKRVGPGDHNQPMVHQVRGDVHLPANLKDLTLVTMHAALGDLYETVRTYEEAFHTVETNPREWKEVCTMLLTIREKGQLSKKGDDTDHRD